LRWRATPGATHYGWQLARDAAFTDLLLQGESATPGVTLPRPDPGGYFLRLRAIDDPAHVPPYGPAQKVEVPAKKVEPPVEVPTDWRWTVPAGIFLWLMLL
jgi:hypothetical protein